MKGLNRYVANFRDAVDGAAGEVVWKGGDGLVLVSLKTGLHKLSFLELNNHLACVVIFCRLLKRNYLGLVH